jgi:hypothetical protein
MKLFVLNSVLEPKNNFKSFKVDVICKYAKNLILKISMNEMYYLRSNLEHYQIYMIHHERFHNTSTIFKSCRGLVEINKLQHYYVIDMFIRFVLTLFVSTATIEQIFLAMKHVKNCVSH